MVTLGGNETKVAGLWNSHDLTAEGADFRIPRHLLRRAATREMA
jgi:hypothetical protein